MRAVIHYGREQLVPLKGPNTDARDQSSPDHHIQLATHARSTRCWSSYERAGASGDFPNWLQITRVEAFGEPAVNRSEQLASLLRLPTVTPVTREENGRVQLRPLADFNIDNAQTL
jgi:hypothetical protein